MKTIGKSFWLIFFLSGQLYLGAKEIDLSTAIEAVVIYPDRALLQRKALVELQRGENRLIISGLTASLIENSLQAVLKPAIDFQITDLKIERTGLQKPVQEKITQLQKDLQKVQEEITRTENLRQTKQLAHNLLAKTPFYGQEKRMTVNEILEMKKFLESNLVTILSEISSLERELEKLKEQKQKLENEIRIFGGAHNSARSVIISVNAERDGTADLQLSYLISGVSWRFKYEMRADSEKKKVLFKCFAEVRQNSGEDWHRVKMELSTARASINRNVPELNPWYLDIYQQPVYFAKPAAPQFREGKAKLDVEEVRAEEADQVEILEGQTAFNFLLPQRIDLPADNQLHKFFLTYKESDAEMSYRAVPKLEHYAFLTARWKNPFLFPLLGGEVAVFLDDKFVSSYSLEKIVTPDETIDLSLGVDESVKLKRYLKKRFTEYEGVFSKDTVVNYEYEIEVINGKERQIELEIVDQIPVSRNEKIRVELHEPDKKIAELKEDGRVIWQIKLNKKEQRKLNLRFNVEFSKKIKVSGLE